MLPRRERQAIASQNAMTRDWWTQERVATLRQMASDGHSLGEIASVLGCKRCRIEGKARREKIKVDGRARFRALNKQRWIKYRIEKLQSELAASATKAHGPVSCVQRETEPAS